MIKKTDIFSSILLISSSIIINMNNFFASGQLSNKIAKRVKVFFSIITGSTLGIMWGKLEWEQRKDWCNSNSLT